MGELGDLLERAAEEWRRNNMAKKAALEYESLLLKGSKGERRSELAGEMLEYMERKDIGSIETENFSFGRDYSHGYPARLGVHRVVRLYRQ